MKHLLLSILLLFLFQDVYTHIEKGGNGNGNGNNGNNGNGNGNGNGTSHGHHGVPGDKVSKHKKVKSEYVDHQGRLNGKAVKVKGERHGHHVVRKQQVHNDVPVVGAELVYDKEGNFKLGQAFDVPDGFSTTPKINGSMALVVVRGIADIGSFEAKSVTLVIYPSDSGPELAYEVIEQPGGERELYVYVNAIDSTIIEIYNNIDGALHATTRPLETSSPTFTETTDLTGQTDTCLVNAHKLAISVYNYFKKMYNRDSLDNNGIALLSYVKNSYANAYFSNPQTMVYGRGYMQYGCFANPIEVGGHEFTHGVTFYESNLIYSGESGGINEAMSDILGVAIAYDAAGKTGNPARSDSLWKIGASLFSDGTSFIRNMCDPPADGHSLDLWTSSAGSVDVHYSSGIANLAFCLLSSGGTHPRSKTSVNVPAIGFSKAANLFYYANADYLTPSSNYRSLRYATVLAANDYGFTAAEISSISNAWSAVKVGDDLNFALAASAGTGKSFNLASAPTYQNIKHVQVCQEACNILNTACVGITYDATTKVCYLITSTSSLTLVSTSSTSQSSYVNSARATNPNTPPAQGGCCFYEHASYGGGSFCISADMYYTTTFNDRISSYTCDSNYRAVVYFDAYYLGASRHIACGQKVSYVGDSWNDKISSIKIYPCTGCCFYQHAYYEGEAICSTTDQSWIGVFDSVISWNDQITSFKCTGGYYTSIYSDAYFSGYNGYTYCNTAIDNLVPYSWNDVISSFKVVSCSGFGASDNETKLTESEYVPVPEEAINLEAFYSFQDNSIAKTSSSTAFIIVGCVAGVALLAVIAVLGVKLKQAARKEDREFELME